MKLIGVLTAALVLCAPVAAGAQVHGMGAPHVAIVHPGGVHVRGVAFRDRDGRGRDMRGRFRGDLLLWGYPYWGWPDCGPDAGCDWDDPGLPPGGYAGAGGPMPADPSCGAWVRRPGGFAWASDACGDPRAADPPARPTLASNECSDWVWRASLHRSVCKRTVRG